MTSVPGRGDERSTIVERTAYRHRLDAFLASREAGDTLTADALRDAVNLRTIVESAAAVAEYVEAAIAITKDEYRPRLECHAGCAYCCRKPGVLVTLPELLRILERVQLTCSDEERAALGERARRYTDRIRGRSFNDPTPESVPCPLLVGERCSAYDIRPLVCRGYNSTSVAACRKAHDDPSSLVPMFAIIKDVTDGASVGVAHALVAAGGRDAMVDLGTALHLAMATDSGFLERALDDGAPLGPAEHATWARELWRGVCATARELGVDVEESETATP